MTASIHYYEPVSKTNVQHFFSSTATDHHVIELSAEHLASAKAAYTTRRIPKEKMATLLTGQLQPMPGDLVLARVAKLGQHERIELGTGRLAPLFIDDEIIVCYGNRYAPDQFEAEVPDHLYKCHLIAAGGIAAQCLSNHGRMKPATEIVPVGLLGDMAGRRLNLRDWALPIASSTPGSYPLTIAVAGTSMNAGKTTTAAHLIKGLVRAGLKVGAAKVTGTGAGGDTWLMRDAGASPVVDFTDAGYPSTYRVSPEETENIFRRLMAHLRLAGVDVCVLEIADGLFQQETANLLRAPFFQAAISGLIFAAGDALGAAGGVQWLRGQNLPVIAVSGMLTLSPLASREAEHATGLPVLRSEKISSADVAELLFEQCGGQFTQPRQA